MSRFHRYSFNNKMLIGMQKPDATKVMGFRQWNTVNRYVKKGEKSIKILAPLIKKKKDDETGLENKLLYGFKAVSVFDISQTDGEPLPKLEILVGGDDHAALLAAVEYCCVKLDVVLGYGKLERGTYGVSMGGAVLVSEHIGQTDKAHVLVHELAHELLHKTEQARQQTERQRELEAEGVSFVVCKRFGLTTPACNYMASYKVDSKMILDSLNTISKTSSTIIDGIEEYYTQQPTTGDSQS